MILKLCGIRCQQDLDAAQCAGFDWCGFVFHPRSPRYVEPEIAARLETGAMKRVGVFVDTPLPELLEIMAEARLDYAQLHGDQDETVTEALGFEKVIRVLWPARHATVTGLEQDAGHRKCAYYLLDSGQNGGGAGVTLDWTALARLTLPAPWLLAGGLNESNARQAMQACNPPGLDFNSGLEDGPGVKNHEKIMAAARTCRAKDYI